MANRNIVLSGVAYWARPHEGQEDEYEDKKFYKITLVPDDESWAKFARTGLKLKKKPVNKDDDAPEGLTFKRDLEGKEIEDKKTGKIKVLGGGPIPVVDSDGQTLTCEIGNGSLVDILVNVYDGEYKKRRYVGHRTEKIRVNKLVKYDPFAEDDLSDFGTGSKVEEEDEEEVPVKKTTKKSDLPF